MMNYKPATFTNGKRERPIRSIKLELSEKPTRTEYDTFSSKGRFKYLSMIKKMVRNSKEYKDYIEFLKKYRGMNKSRVLPNVANVNGKRYSIELHHEPFTLFEICDIVLTKRQTLGESENPFKVAEEVLELHYDGKVGLIPLDITCHELCESGLIFIPLQDIFQRYDQFYDEYSALCTIPPKIEKKLELKLELSEQLESGVIMTDMLNPQFTYLEVSGMQYPEIPAEWGEAMKINDQELYLKEAKDQK